MRTISLDFETFYIKDEYSVADLGNWRYCNDERFDPFLLALYDGETSWVGHPRDLNWAALEGAELLAHNAGFDSAVHSRMAELNTAPELPNKWICTANMTSCLASERSLAGALWSLEKVRLPKEARDFMNKKHWHDIVAAGAEKRVIEYAARDAVECYRLYHKYGHLWSPYERRLSDFTIMGCRRGVQVNVDKLKEYRDALVLAIWNLEQSLPWTKRDRKPTSPIAIAEECNAVGIPAPPVKTKDEEGFSEWEMTYGPRFPWVYGAGRWRSMRKLLSSLDTIKERLRPDDTIDFSLLYFGGHTGRWSGGGSGLNMQNLRKEPLFIKSGHFAEMPADVARDAEAKKEWLKNTVVLDIRSLFIPRPGKKFILSDLSQVEPRVLNWLAGNHELLGKIANEGFSYYEAYAALYKGWQGKPGTIKQELGGKGYTLLKNECLGLGYGMGAERFMGYVAENGGSVTEEEAQATVDTFRANNPLIAGKRDAEGHIVAPGLWQSLEIAFKRSLGGHFENELPSGRTMTYRDVRREVRTKKDKDGKPEKRFVFIANVGHRREELYGGKLTENLVQATARDVFGTHLLALEEQVGDVIFHVHDEAIVEVNEDKDALKEVEKVMSTAPEWLPGCPLAAEAKEAPHYLK